MYGEITNCKSKCKDNFISEKYISQAMLNVGLQSYRYDIQCVVIFAKSQTCYTHISKQEHWNLRAKVLAAPT